MHQKNRDDALRWLNAILWPDGGTEIEAVRGDGHGDGPDGGQSDPGARTWWASPSAAEPSILIPADAPAAARRAVRRYHDGFDLGRRAKSLLAEATMTMPGMAGLALRHSMVAERPTGDGHGPGVLDALADLLGQPDLVVAIGLSVPKSNRKPVLQLLTPTGHCLGWAKVGWSLISERLVANEASWLGRPTVGGPLVVPRLLHDEVLVGRRVVVTSAVDAARRPVGRPDAVPGPELFRAVAARGTTDVVPIIESTWWRSVTAAMVVATNEERAAIEATLEAADGHRFEVGAWHGDLTPWNLMTSSGQVQLIDWELAADGVPVGFDLCHFHTQVGAEMKGLDAPAALARSARLSPQGLAVLGIDAANHPILWRLYLVELVRRLLVLRNDGYPTEHVHHGPAALARLSAMADRQRSVAYPSTVVSR